MKFLCSHCKAKYQIADERLAGRTLRMTCRSCGQEILLRGDPNSPSNRAPAAITSNAPSIPSALGADFQSAMAGSLHPLPPAVPIDEWHVAINDAPVGPMRREEVARRLSSGGLGPDSLAWREGLDDWMPIRAIPELAVLFPQGQLSPPLGLPPAPIGGRGGAAPSYALDDWAPVTERSQSFASPLHDNSSPGLAPPRGPSMPMMFAVACGFAFLMSAMTILGAGWLRGRQQNASAEATNGAPTNAAPATTPTTTDTAHTAEGDQGADMTITLDDPGLNAQNGRPTKPATGTATGGKPKKELTAAQKEMLARMGGGESSDLGALQRKSEQAAAAKSSNAGSLTADQLNGVVQRGKKNLQRCYESALRGAGADSTIRLDVQLSVSPAGNVTSVQVSGQGLPGMNECISRTVKMWRFPNAGEASATRFPLLFQPGA